MRTIAAYSCRAGLPGYVRFYELTQTALLGYVYLLPFILVPPFSMYQPYPLTQPLLWMRCPNLVLQPERLCGDSQSSTYNFSFLFYSYQQPPTSTNL